MRLPLAVLVSFLLTSAAANTIDGVDNVVRSDVQTDEHDLYKRRGGGGGGGRGGGGGGGSSGGSRGGSSGGSSGGGSRGGSGSSRPSNTSPSSNRGGTSPGGSGPRPAYGGGRYYGGGGAVPYQPGPGRRTPSAGLLPVFLIGGAALAFWPGVWLYGAYTYDFDRDFTFHNATTDKEETRPVKCGCAPYNPCGCDEPDEDDYEDYLRDLVGNGSYAALDKDVIDVGEYRGRKYLLINGTLPNGTTADGPLEAGEAGDDDSPAMGLRTYAETLGFWPVIGAAVAAAVFMA